MKLAFWKRTRKKEALSHLDDRGRWTRVFDWYPGAFQSDNMPEITEQRAYHAVFACMTLIAGDIGKLRWRLVRQVDGIWTEAEQRELSALLKKPNHYQNPVQFREWWALSKLSHGNTYALKQRDARGVVTGLYLMDACSTTPLVSEEGDVFYQFMDDNLTGLRSTIIVPASEVIHDRMNCVFHPLIGLSPLYACGLAATQGLKMQNNATKFFNNNSRPSGILTAPGAISQETADRLKTSWQTNYSGDNYGKMAVLGDDLKFQPLSMSPESAQMLEQMKWTAEVVCSTFHVPPFKIGIGQRPTAQNVESENVSYYTDCLQSLITNMECSLSEGLGTMDASGGPYKIDIEESGLLRMDTSTKFKTLIEGINGGLITTDEGRQSIDRPKVDGGDVIWRQQQDFSIAALAERDRNDPFAKPEPAPAPTQPDDDMSEDEEDSIMEDAA